MMCSFHNQGCDWTIQPLLHNRDHTRQTSAHLVGFSRDFKGDFFLRAKQGHLSFFVKASEANSRIPKDSGSKPKVVPTHRDYFGVAFVKNHQPQRGCGSRLLTAEHVRVTTPLGLFSSSPYRPRVVPMGRDNPGLEDAIPLGLNKTAAQKMRC